MNVLLVEDQIDLAELWASALKRCGATVFIAASEDEAIRILQVECPGIVILNLELKTGSPLAVADFAGYRHPQTPIIPVTSSSFFSDGSVFRHMPNACTTMARSIPPDDMTAIVEHYCSTTGV